MSGRFASGPANGTEERIEALLNAQTRTNELLEQLVDRLPPKPVDDSSKTIDLREHKARRR